MFGNFTSFSLKIFRRYFLYSLCCFESTCFFLKPCNDIKSNKMILLIKRHLKIFYTKIIYLKYIFKLQNYLFNFFQELMKTHTHTQNIFLNFGEWIHSKYSLSLSLTSPHTHLLHFFKFFNIFTADLKMTSKLLVSSTLQMEKTKTQLEEAPTF